MFDEDKVTVTPDDVHADRPRLPDDDRVTAEKARILAALNAETPAPSDDVEPQLCPSCGDKLGPQDTECTGDRDHIHSIRTAIAYMRSRLESKQGGLHTAMCRLSLPMSEALLADREWWRRRAQAAEAHIDQEQETGPASPLNEW